MKSNYRRIGDFIRLVDERNKGLKVTNLVGLSISKQFIKSVANTIGTDMENYKIIRQNQFACSTMQVRRDKKMPLALYTDMEPAIISQAYPVFEIIDVSVLSPEYLMMWFTRSEFDRQACFHAVGGVRGSLEWEDFLDLELPIPSIEKQRAIVNEYNTVVNRIQLNEQLNQKLEETAQAIYKQWFVDFEFHCLPENYKFTGAVKPQNYDSIMSYKRVGGLPVPDGKSWFVYVLLCDDGSLYKGMTNDLYRRFYEHFTGTGAKHTKLHRPVKTIHWEQFNSQEEARKKEEELKTGYGRTWLSRQIEKAGGLHLIKTDLPAPTTQLRTAGKMVWCEELEKEIPECWEVKALGDFIESYSKKHDFKKEELIFFNTSDILNGEFLHSNYMKVSEMPGQAKKRIAQGDILYSEIRPANKRYALVRFETEDYVVSTKLMVLRAKSNRFTPERIYKYLTEKEFIDELQFSAEGKSGTFPQITFELDIENKPFLIASDQIEKRWSDFLRNYYEQTYSRKDENRILNDLKEIVLSKMTRVKEATIKEML